MMQMGFSESTRSGLSFATDDLVADTKTSFIKYEKEVETQEEHDRGL